MKNPERIKLIGYLLTNRAALEVHDSNIKNYLQEVGIKFAESKVLTRYPKYSDLAIAFRKLEGEFYALRDEVSELKAQLGINASS